MDKSEFRHKVFNFSEQLYPMVYRFLGNQHSAEDAIENTTSSQPKRINCTYSTKPLHRYFATKNESSPY